MRISTNWMKLTGTRIGVAVFAAALALALPAQADEKTSQVAFVANCNDDGEVDVPEGTQLEVFNGLFAAPAQGVITRDCTVTLEGEDSELNLAEGTDLLFATCAALCAGICDAACIAGNVGDYKSFTIETDIAGGAGFEIEIQVKKNSIIEAEDVNFTITGAEEAEAQFEENFCLACPRQFEFVHELDKR